MTHGWGVPGDRARWGARWRARGGAAGARAARTRGVGGWVPVGGAAPGLSGWQPRLREQQHHPGAEPPRLRLTATQTLPLPPDAPNRRQRCLGAASAAAAPAPAPPPPRAHAAPIGRAPRASPRPRPLAAPAAPPPARPRRPRLGCGRRPGSPEPSEGDHNKGSIRGWVDANNHERLGSPSPRLRCCRRRRSSSRRPGGSAVKPREAGAPRCRARIRKVRARSPRRGRAGHDHVLGRGAPRCSPTHRASPHARAARPEPPDRGGEEHYHGSDGPAEGRGGKRRSHAQVSHPQPRHPSLRASLGPFTTRSPNPLGWVWGRGLGEGAGCGRRRPPWGQGLWAWAGKRLGGPEEGEDVTQPRAQEPGEGGWRLGCRGGWGGPRPPWGWDVGKLSRADPTLVEGPWVGSRLGGRGWVEGRGGGKKRCWE